MKLSLLILFCIVTSLVAVAAGMTSTTELGSFATNVASNTQAIDTPMPPTAYSTMERLGKMPLAFTENVGQWDDRALFKASTKGTRIWFSEDGVYYQFIEELNKMVLAEDQPPDLASHSIRISCAGSNPDASYVGEGELEFKSSFYLGNDPSKWQEAVTSYKAVRCPDIYPGIDLKYYGSDTRVEYDFIVSPGADPSQIVLRYDGIESLSINESGQLVVSTGWGDIVEEHPVVYQLDGESRIEVEGEYSLLPDNSLCFEIGDYDTDKSLVIDPVVSYLAYSTYLGGSSFDGATCISVCDPTGEDKDWIAVAGITVSVDFPTLNPVQGSNAGGIDAFVTVMDIDGNLIASTYLGGSDEDRCEDVYIDKHWNGYVLVYIVGTTQSNDFPLYNAMQTTYGGGGTDAFVSEIMVTTTLNLLSSTYLGGSSQDNGTGICYSTGTDRIVVAGWTFSEDFPTAYPYQASLAGESDAFVTTLNYGPLAIDRSTYLGGSLGDYAEGVSADPNRFDIYITGSTYSTDFPTENAYQSSIGGSDDAFLSSFYLLLDSLVFSTYLGGSDGDFAMGIDVGEVDYETTVYIVGETWSTDFPTRYPYQTDQPSADAFYSEFDASGSLLRSTYLGGSDYEAALDISVRMNQGMVSPGESTWEPFVVGYTYSDDFPLESEFQSTLAGNYLDGFITRFSVSGGSLEFSSYLGGQSADHCYGIAIYDDTTVVVGGMTESPDFPTVDPFQTYQSDGDAFVSKIVAAPTPWTCGDVNNNGSLNSEDPQVLWDYMCYGLVAPPYMEACDVDECGDVNVGDVAYLYDYLFSTGGPPCEGSVDCDLPTDGYSVDLGVPVTGSPGSTVELPIYISTDAPLRAVSLGFSYDSEDIEVTAITQGIEWDRQNYTEADELNKTVFIAGCAIFFEQTGGLLATLEIEISPSADYGSVDFDSVFIEPIGDFIFTAWDGGSITPAFNDNGTEDLIIQEQSYLCGDADESGGVDIDDVVYLIEYVFQGGPEPIPIESGNADCEGVIDIDDIVYLIDYLFLGGYDPCDPDGNGSPDC